LRREFAVFGDAVRGPNKSVTNFKFLHPKRLITLGVWVIVLIVHRFDQAMVNDVVGILAETENPIDCIKIVRKRDREFAEGWGQIVTLLKLLLRGETNENGNGGV
jgi:hypothetical protein